MRISDWRSDVCFSDLPATGADVCRSLAARAAGCVPINLFGDGAPSPEAIDYVTGETWRAWDLTQDAAAVTLRGEPFSTWAGPVSLATGVEWRHEKIGRASCRESECPYV